MTVLNANGLTKDFGGFRAVDDIDLTLQPGEMRGLIGSNGAGKSTLLHLIYGQIRPDAGTICFQGNDVTQMAAGERARRGMGLVFQVANIFDDLTVEQNLILGAAPKELNSRTSHDLIEVDKTLEMVELIDLRHFRASHLSHGQKQWLEIGMVLLTKPRLLLLDEPTSGMTRAESERTARLLRDLQQTVTVQSMLIVEHNIEFIRLVSDRVTVMHRGSILAEGTIDEVQSNKEVQAAYLGRLT